jgi:hypothetical protein
MISLSLVEFVRRDCLKHRHRLATIWLMVGFSLFVLSYFLGVLPPACSLYPTVIEVTRGTLKANCERTHAEKLDLDQDDMFTKLLDRQSRNNPRRALVPVQL